MTSLPAAAARGSWKQSPLSWYGLALLLFALGLMSKPMLVTWPFLLLLLDYWPLGRLSLGSATTKPPTDPEVADVGERFGERTVPAIAPTIPWTRLLLEKLPFLALAMISSTPVCRSSRTTLKFYESRVTTFLPILARSGYQLNPATSQADPLALH